MTLIKCFGQTIEAHHGIVKSFKNISLERILRKDEIERAFISCSAVINAYEDNPDNMISLYKDDIAEVYAFRGDLRLM